MKRSFKLWLSFAVNVIIIMVITMVQMVGKKYWVRSGE